MDARPELLALAMPFYQCFIECSSDRARDSMGGPLSIPRMSVTDWLNENRVTDAAERLEFRALVSRLDARSCVLARRQMAREHNRNLGPGGKPMAVEVDDPDEDDC